ncbi:single-pass membrane and coiled-coil domain-containing protein 4 [Trachinotus anak]
MRRFILESAAGSVGDSSFPQTATSSSVRSSGLTHCPRPDVSGRTDRTCSWKVPVSSQHRREAVDIMRQLKGKPKKETSKDKKERKQAMQEARQQVATIVLPTLAVVVLLIVVFVYVATRPGAIE